MAFIDPFQENKPSFVDPFAESPATATTTPNVPRGTITPDFSGQAKGQSIPAPNQDVINSMSGTDKFLAGTGKGFMDLYKGGKQIALGIGKAAGLVNDSTVTDYNNKVFNEAALYKPLSDSSTAANVGEFVGKTAPWLVMPGGAATSLGGRVATGAATGAAMGALDPVTGDKSRATNTLWGAGLGGAIPVAMGAASKVWNAAANKVASNPISDLGSKFNIRTTLGEQTGNPIIQKAETLLESVPITGIKNFRIKQGEDAANAVKNHFSQYVINPSLSSTADMKIANDAHLDTLYQKVKDNAAKIPEATAPDTRTAATEMLDRYPDVFEKIQDTKVKRILTNIFSDTTDKTVNTGLLDSTGQAIKRTETPTFSFNDLWELRKGIGRELGDAKTGTARSQLGQVYAAVSNDLDSMLANSKGTGLIDFKNANESFKQYSVKFDVLREAYDKASGTIGAGEMFSPKRYSTALKNLANDPRYKKNVKWSPSEIENMTGLANILQVAKRGGQYAENPPTGNRWGSLLTGGLLGESAYLAGGAAGAVKTAGGTLAITGLAKFLTTTTAGKRLAMAASKVEPSSPMMSDIMNQIYRLAPRTAVSYSQTGK